jgi:hypothetical protein
MFHSRREWTLNEPYRLHARAKTARATREVGRMGAQGLCQISLQASCPDAATDEPTKRGDA